jgi:hypothetical protein
MKSIVLSLLAAVTVTSCATGPNAQTGTVVGALGGAAVGGIIGNQSGRGLEALPSEPDSAPSAATPSAMPKTSAMPNTTAGTTPIMAAVPPVIIRMAAPTTVLLTDTDLLIV